MAKEPEGQAAEHDGAPKKKSKLLLIIVLVAAILMVGGGGFFAYIKFLKPPAVKPEDQDITLQKKPAVIVGEMLSLEPFIVNLSDSKGKRYLKVELDLELENLAAVERAEKFKPKMRHTVIMMLTSLTFEEVMTPEGKTRVKDELQERFSRILKPDKINDIYFTQFVVQ